MAKYSLCSTNNVRAAAGIGSDYSDITDTEIDTFINNAEAYIYANYYPVVRTKINIDDQATLAGSLRLKFTPDFTDYSIYNVGSIFFDGAAITETSGSTLGSFNIDKSAGKIIFTTAGSILLTENSTIDFEFIPDIFNKLSAAYAAMELLDTQAIVTGKDAASTKIDRIEKTIARYEEILRPKGAVMTVSGGITSGRVYTVSNYLDDVQSY
jgi:hypothetical protein